MQSMQTFPDPKLRASLKGVNEAGWCVLKSDRRCSNSDSHAVAWLVGLGLSSANSGEIGDESDVSGLGDRGLLASRLDGLRAALESGRKLWIWCSS
jgi:hypothetical protein